MVRRMHENRQNMLMLRPVTSHDNHHDGMSQASKTSIPTSKLSRKNLDKLQRSNDDTGSVTRVSVSNASKTKTGKPSSRKRQMNAIDNYFDKYHDINSTKKKRA